MILGQLDKYITIETPTISSDSETNQKKITGWTTYKNVWAQRVVKQSTETTEGNQYVFMDMAEFRMHYYDAPDINNQMRISFDGDYYYIIGIKPIERKRGWIVTTGKRDNE